MAKKARLLKSKLSKGYESISEIISHFALLPCEEDERIETLRSAVRAELKPVTPFEEWLTEDILMRMLEVTRIRRMRATSLSISWKEVVYSALRINEDFDGDSEEKSALVKFSIRLLEARRDYSDIAAFNEELSKFGTSLNDLHLRAYERVADDIDKFDRRIDFLERRLRSVYEHFRSMREWRLRQERNRDAEDIAS